MGANGRGPVFGRHDANDRQQSLDLSVRAADEDRQVLLASAALGLDQRFDRARVDEVAAAEVEQNLTLVGPRSPERRPQATADRQVELALDRDLPPARP